MIGGCWLIQRKKLNYLTAHLKEDKLMLMLLFQFPVMLSLYSINQHFLLIVLLRKWATYFLPKLRRMYRVLLTKGLLPIIIIKRNAALTVISWRGKYSRQLWTLLTNLNAEGSEPLVHKFASNEIMWSTVMPYGIEP